MPQLVAGQAPPAHYYADNLVAVIQGVRHQYGDLLTAAEAAFGERIVAASRDAQRLLARIIARKGCRARVDSLRYREVANTATALAELADAGLLLRCPEVPAETLLGMLSAGEIARWLPAAAGRHKAALVETALAAYPDAALHHAVARHCPWVGLADMANFELHRLLFFGDRHADLATFVLRDLAIARYEERPLGPERRLFPDRAALDEFVALCRIGDHARRLGPAPAPARAQVVLEALWHPVPRRAAERRRSRILNGLGRRLERHGALDLALACYARSTLPPGRERRVRILARLGDARAVRRLTRMMRERPRDALEARFARRFGQPPRRRPAHAVTHVAWQPSYAADVEGAAATLLAAGGGHAWHLENALPLGLFGLAYWDWVFAPVAGMFVTAFQTAPMDLFWPDFLAERRPHCADPLALDDDALRERIVATAARRRGVANRLVDWRAWRPGRLERLLAAVPMAAIRKLLALTGEDLEAARSGFPDLTVVHGAGAYEFVEVKGPGDQLREPQRLWLERLDAAGLPASVLRFR